MTTQTVVRNLRGLHPQWLSSTPHLSRTVQRNAFTLFAFLYTAVYRTVKIRGFHPSASAVTVLSAGSLVETELAISPTTYSLYMHELRGAGLVDYKAQTVSTPSNWNAHLPEKIRRAKRTPRALSTGTLMALRLLPGYSAVQLRWEDFEEYTRDFANDLVTGNTVAAYKAQLTEEDKTELKRRKLRWQHGLEKTGDIYIPKDWEQDVYVLSQFLLPSFESAKTPLLLSLQKIATAQNVPHWVQTLVLEDVLVLTEYEGDVLPAAIDMLAIRIRERLGDDPNSLVWHKVLWRLRALALSGQNRLQHFLDQVNSVWNSQQQGHVRNGPATLIARMKASGLWALLKTVGVKQTGSYSSIVREYPHDPVELDNEELDDEKLSDDELAFLKYATSAKK